MITSTLNYSGSLFFEYHLNVAGTFTLNDLLKMLNKDYKCRITRSGNIFGIIHCIRK